MKKLKFLIVVLGFMAAHGVMAVTLPTTSYTPYSSGDDFSSSVITPSGVSMRPTSFMSLGKGTETDFEACITNNPGPENFIACQNCVSEVYSDCMSACSTIKDEDERDACEEACDSYNGKYMSDCGRSLPLDAPLWFMLAFAAVGAAFSVALRKRLA